MALQKAPQDAAQDFREGRCILYSVGPAKGFLPGTDMTADIVPSRYSIVDMEASDGKSTAKPSAALHAFALAYAPTYNRIAVQNCGRTL
jgi:hypothetical protein